MGLQPKVVPIRRPLTAPFPWFGGKRRVSHLVWQALGDVQNYVEPFAGSMAGWWVWGISQWIGGHWCSRSGLGNKRPELRGNGIHAESRRDLVTVMEGLSARLRRVRVCCGDWSRVVTDGVLNWGKQVGVLLDPPYALSERDPNLYTVDSAGISGQVREWCLRHAKNPRVRIVLCGYEGEHKMPRNWRVIEWAGGNPGVRSGTGGGRNAENRFRERLWLSPSCLPVSQAERVAA